MHMEPNSSGQTRGLRAGIFLLALIIVASTVCMITAEPPGKRKEAMIGAAGALLTLAAVFTTIYRVARAMDREESEVERMQTRSQEHDNRPTPPDEAHD
jgi:hypothetical protein